MPIHVTEKAIEIPTPDGRSDGFFYFPESTHKTWPGIIHLTDISGIRPAQQQMAQRLAAEGYAVLMPNIFYRNARPPVLDFRPSGDERTRVRMAELTGPMTPDAIEHDAVAYIDFLEKQPEVKAGSFGVVGYCFSGAITMRIAAARPDKIAAAASFHGGRLYTDAATSPHLLLPRIKARLYFGHAVEDRSMPADAIDKLDHALATWGGKYVSETYPGAHHSWTTPDSPVFDQGQADRAFATLTQLFRETVG